MRQRLSPFNAKEYNQSVQDLKARNGELKHLREQIAELQDPKPKTLVKPRLKHRAFGNLAYLDSAQHASKALHGVLVNKWKCGQPGHNDHAVKLFVETGHYERQNIEGGELSLYLAIDFKIKTVGAVHSTLVQLEVRSREIELTESTTTHPPILNVDDCSGAIRKGQKVASLPEPSGSATRSSTMTIPVATRTQQSLCLVSRDLSESHDICEVLNDKSWQSLGTFKATCMGHLDGQSEKRFRHSFYPANGRIHGTALTLSPSLQATRMDRMVVTPNEKLFTLVDKLRLAKALVSAVLKFHSTPWLREYWGLQDLALFHSDGKVVSNSLQTLHVGTELAQRQLNSMEGVQDGAPVDEDEPLFCGIGNLTLHSLGVALLQIDREVDIKPSDVMQVRRMAMATSTLGPRYQGITQKCLRCDFGYGSDLSKPRLQEAIWDNVVGVLEKSISWYSVED